MTDEGTGALGCDDFHGAWLSVPTHPAARCISANGWVILKAQTHCPRPEGLAPESGE